MWHGAAIATATARHGHELVADELVGLAHHLDELGHVARIVVREKGVGRAGVGAARRAANAMYVVLGLIGVVDVDHEFDVGDVCCLVKRLANVGHSKTQTNNEKKKKCKQNDQKNANGNKITKKTKRR